MHVYLCVCRAHMHLCTESRGQPWVPFFSCFPPLWTQYLSLNPVLFQADLAIDPWGSD